ncbi:bestrophin family protein [Aequorivita echinoideorum]|uniref:Bestrophin, RFP-TM, chloride channel n=1 Tax=Aequorivita echinoideorum TaxID=1549647 RepID=A0ABS5S163_9FLAO|nr:bestrophin family ion channel [Aequorivita echinoideorum]MBT0606951.1 hypothetical protein [Aequorivita echinoideorum]
MYVRRQIRWTLIFRYTWLNIALFIAYSFLIFCVYNYLGWTFIDIPFEPLTVIGIAVSFYVGFKNSQSYERFWEGRKIWGNVVNYSRTWTIQVLSFVQTGNTEADKIFKKRMVYRHIAWMNALRIQLRQSRPWTLDHGYFMERMFNRHGERDIPFDMLSEFLDNEEYKDVTNRVNPATHLIKNQAADISQLRKTYNLDALQEQTMHGILEMFYNLQGMCERIKNTPFPRQYGDFSRIFTWVFVLLIPLGLLNIFEEHVYGDVAESFEISLLFLQMIPFTVLIMWIFTTMELVGDISEDPFEGRTNDVPITALCRTIEIDLRDMLDEDNLPPPVLAKDDILY